MEIIEIISLSIVSLVIFIFIYRYFIKPRRTVISNYYTGSKNAKSGYCVPFAGGVVTHTCSATYSMDLKIEEYDHQKDAHVFSIIKPLTVTSDPTKFINTNSQCYSFKAGEDIDYKNTRLTLQLKKDINTLLVTTRHYRKGETIAINNIPLKQWANISVVFDTNIMEIYINGNLRETYILDVSVDTGAERMVTTQQSGFTGYIRNVQYIPEALESKEINKLFSNKPSGIGNTVTRSASNAINYLVELPGKYFYNYDNGSCA